MYEVVEFTDHKEVAVVPDTWLNGTSCALWPGYKTESRNISSARKREAPGKDWPAFPH
jgi:hypothetical protein